MATATEQISIQVQPPAHPTPDTDGVGQTVPSMDAAIEVKGLNAYYGAKQAVRDVTFAARQRAVTAIIGPSGCGKSTVLRSLNRMLEVVPSARIEGEILFHGVDIYARDIDPAAVRRTIGMVFQQPNPFPTMSIYDNVVAAARFNGLVKGRAQGDEQLARDLAKSYAIVIVTHNMQQAARVSDDTVFMSVDEQRAGFVVESGPTSQIFTNPQNKTTEDYITGRFG